jgi:hypothetical protein
MYVAVQVGECDGCAAQVQLMMGRLTTFHFEMSS